MNLETKLRVIFVDDDELLLRCLTRVARQSLEGAEVESCADPRTALRRLRESPADIVVADLQMEGMDGAAFLRHVRAADPGCTRVVLSGAPDVAEVAAALDVAHQVLAKPVEMTALADTLRAARDTRAAFRDTTLRALVAQDNALPSPPGVYLRLRELSDDPDLGAVVDVVSTDVGLSARVLQLANSAFVGGAGHVGTVAQGILRLGLVLTTAVVLAHETGKHFATNLRGFDAEAHRTTSLRAAAIARRVLAGTPLAEPAFVAGLLHGIGYQVLASRVPERYGVAAARTDVLLDRALREAVGVAGPEVGSFLLGLWGLPGPIVQAVAAQHRPRGAVRPDVTTAVHVARHLARDPDAPLVDGGLVPEAGLDAGTLEALGLAAQLADWRAFARELVGGGAAAA